MKDSFTYEGAIIIANRLRYFWKKRGFAIDVRIEKFGTDRFKDHEPLFHVRSNLVGGMPPK